MKAFRLTATVLAASLTFALSAGSVTAATISGNPAADGWELQGNSLAQGVYVRGARGYDYDVYAQEFILGASNPLFNISANWQAGDIVVGFGGVAKEALNQTFRSVTKFGGSVNNTFAPESVPFANDGIGSTANGGPGTVLTGFNFTRASGALNGAWNGELVIPQTFRYINAASTALNYDSNAAVKDYARILALFSGAGTSSDPNIVTSWQSFINISAMERDSLFGGTVPGRGAPSIVTRQQSTSSATDAFAVATPIPLPAAGWLLLGGLGALGFAARRKRKMVA